MSADLINNIGRVKNVSLGGVNTVYLFPYVKYNRSQITIIDQTITSFPATMVNSVHSTVTNYAENTEIEGGDVGFNQSFNLQFPITHVESELYKLVKQLWRAIYVDRLGNIRMLGVWNGLEATFNNETGTAKPDLNGYRISLSGKEDNQAYYLNDLTDFTLPSENDNFVFMDGCNFIFTNNDNFIFI